MIVLMQPSAAPNTGNFVLLVLAVWGAIADSRYKAKGGKQTSKEGRKGLLIGLALCLILLVVLAIRGVGEDALIKYAVTLLLLAFAGWEALRFWVRRNNPLPRFK